MSEKIIQLSEEAIKGERWLSNTLFFNSGNLKDI